MGRRINLLIVAAAVVIALIAWAVLASDESDAPGNEGYVPVAVHLTA